MKTIAEIGSNLRVIHDVYAAITIAKSSGADIIKFQSFTDKEMFGADHGGNQIFKDEWLKPAFDKAESVGIEFCCTFFSPEKLENYLPLLNTIKIASSDMLYTDILDVAKASGKKILLSTGGHSSIDVKRAVQYLKGTDLVLLYCEAVYPARCTDMRKLNILKEIHPVVGFSDHSLEIYTNPLLAKEMGCEYLEKHANFSTYRNTPDAGHSLNPREFKLMVDAIKGVDKEILLKSYEEREMTTRHIRRLIATRPIARGSKFKYKENYGQYRSITDDTNGYPGYAWKGVNGRIAKRDISAGESIGPGEVSL